MKKKHDLLGILLAATTAVALLVGVIIRTLAPRINLPRLDAIAIVTLSLAALLLDHYLTRGGSKRDYRFLPLYGVWVFGLFPFAACFTSPMQALMMAALGGVSFTVVTFLFDSLSDRLSDSPATVFAPAVSAFGIFLAAQCLMGII